MWTQGRTRCDWPSTSDQENWLCWYLVDRSPTFLSRHNISRSGSSLSISINQRKTACFLEIKVLKTVNSFFLFFKWDCYFKPEETYIHLMYIFHNLTILCYIVIFNKIQCGELLFYSIVTKVSKFAAIWISDCFYRVSKK